MKIKIKLPAFNVINEMFSSRHKCSFVTAVKNVKYHTTGTVVGGKYNTGIG